RRAWSRGVYRMDTFNENKGCVKLDKDDINKDSQANGEDCIEIEVEFIDLPNTVVIDATNSTTLAEEYLLTEQNTLSIIKKYPKAGKEQVFIRAFHPTNPVCQDLLQKKITELRRILDENGIDCEYRNKSSEIRKSIWQSQENLEQKEVEIEISKTEVKSIWEQLKSYMPLYTLFQSDRKNSESDEEVQDPLKYAVKEIINEEEIQTKLNEVADQVKIRLNDVANRT